MQRIDHPARHRWARALTAVVAVGLLAAACGDTDDTTTTPATGAATNQGPAAEVGPVDDTTTTTTETGEQSADGVEVGPPTGDQLADVFEAMIGYEGWTAESDLVPETCGEATIGDGIVLAPAWARPGVDVEVTCELDAGTPVFVAVVPVWCDETDMEDDGFDNVVEACEGWARMDMRRHTGGPLDYQLEINGVDRTDELEQVTTPEVMGVLPSHFEFAKPDGTVGRPLTEPNPLAMSGWNTVLELPEGEHTVIVRFFLDDAAEGQPDIARVRYTFVVA